MHELSVTENLLDITLRHAQNAGATRITNIYLVIGQLSSIVDDSVKFYWDMIAKDTIAQKAILHFKRISIRLTCLDCSHEYEPTGDELSCPKCDGIHVKVLKGEEFYVEAIDIEK
ncbi:MAG: hydrogenase maturation nickel metallochaperone HypA [Chloroflexi bacterium RBG_19FT_COMBO_47_9]|nr:MAG: hydrogenase maturation nickel metallochaperone HypA [Chloroflexi bacterium RBG_19FT_COMBO_47_9]